MRHRVVRFLIALALLAITPFAAIAAEVIHTFDSTVQLARDGTMTVTETLRVRAEGRDIKRGIFRDFPMTFRDAAGREREVDFKLLDVMRDGKAEPHFTERNQNVLRIYAGDKDVIVPPGDHTYVFRYVTGRQVRWFGGMPELNWNVTGNYWNFPILKARYRLELVNGARPLRFTAYTGPVGARDANYTGAIGSNGVLSVETTRPLAAGEGLTVVAALPEVSVAPLTAEQIRGYWLSDNRHWLFAGFGFLAVLIYYVVAWRAVGRDPRRGIVIPRFHPPQGVSPALANYIDHWGFGRNRWRAFTAASLSLAVRGLITFDQDDDKLILKAKEGAAKADGLPAGEAEILKWVREQGIRAVIDRAHGAAVSAIGQRFTAKIEGESKDRFFRRNLGYVIAGIVLTVVVIVGTMMTGGLQENDIGILAASIFGSFFLGMFIVPVVAAITGGEGIRNVFRSVLSFMVFAIFISFFFLLVTTIVPDEPVEVASEFMSFVSEYPFSFVLVSAFAVLNGLFFYLMKAPTTLGRPIMDELAGLRLYLETAEADRMNLQAPEITAERFEALLPYAVALGVEKPWSDAFAAALKRAHPAEAEPMQHYQPAWGRTGSRWSAASFGSAVAATVGSVNSALASAIPPSSGSSGFSSGGSSGGGSGGGGGGGGGGGW